MPEPGLRAVVKSTARFSSSKMLGSFAALAGEARTSARKESMKSIRTMRLGTAGVFAVGGTSGWPARSVNQGRLSAGREARIEGPVRSPGAPPRGAE